MIFLNKSTGTDDSNCYSTIHHCADNNDKGSSVELARGYIQGPMRTTVYYCGKTA